MINSKLLQKCYVEKKICIVFANDEDPQKCIIGYVGYYNADEVLIYITTVRGVYNGYVVIKMADIFKIRCDGPYENAAQTLYQSRSRKHENVLVCNNDVTASLLDLAKREKYIVYIVLDDERVQGYVRTYDGGKLILENVTDYGEDDGACELPIETIKLLYVDTEDEQDICLLKNAKTCKSAPDSDIKDNRQGRSSELNVCDR